MNNSAGLNFTDMPELNGVVLVAGDGGLIGSYAARRYHELGWEVHGVSRRDLDVEWTHHRADLLTGEGLPTDVLARVTHLVFGAYIEKPTDAELIEVNDALLQNTLDALQDTGAPGRRSSTSLSTRAARPTATTSGSSTPRPRRPTPV